MWPLRLFQRYIISRQGNLLTIYFNMSMRKRRAPTDAQATDGGTSVPKRTDALDLDTNGSYTEATSPLFDPNRVVLRVSSSWTPTKPDISLSVITPRGTINPWSKLVFLSKILFSSRTTTCQRSPNTSLHRFVEGRILHC